MPSPQALARCAELVLLPRSPAQEKIASRILLEIAVSLAPGVEQTAENVCTVDLRSAKIPDHAAWGRAIVERFAALRLDARIGVAETPDLALFAAHAAEPVQVVGDSTAFLSAREVEELEPSPALLRILQDWGIRDLGALSKLPKSEIAARLGLEAAALWEQAAGKSERPLNYVRPPEVFAEAFEFEHEVETVEPLLFLLRRFLEQLTLRLRAVYRVAKQMRLVLPLENGHAHARAFTIPAPTADVETLFRILHTHLEGLRLEHRPTALRLSMKAAAPENRQLQIFENPLRDPNRFGETLARLAALAGEDRVGIPQRGSTHRPGQYDLQPVEFGLDETPDLLVEETPDLSIGLPLRRYRPPHPARVEIENGQPVAVFSETLRGPICDTLGPYRFSGEWWDASAWEVEEWDVEVEGRGLYRLCRMPGGWEVAGGYDEGL
jgi:protein ImuB